MQVVQWVEVVEGSGIKRTAVSPGATTELVGAQSKRKLVK
jgi:hypothetical protein